MTGKDEDDKEYDGLFHRNQSTVYLTADHKETFSCRACCHHLQVDDRRHRPHCHILVVMFIMYTRLGRSTSYTCTGIGQSGPVQCHVLITPFQPSFAVDTLERRCCRRRRTTQRRMVSLSSLTKSLYAEDRTSITQERDDTIYPKAQ